MTVLFFKNRRLPKKEETTSLHPSHIKPFIASRRDLVAFECDGFYYAKSTSLTWTNPLIEYTKDVSGQSIEQWIKTKFGATEITKISYKPGTYYDQIWRPGVRITYFRDITNKDFSKKLTQATVSLRLLLDKLEELFSVIEPAPENSKVYGLKIREIFLLACMEVESNLSSVLEANNYKYKGTLSTKDYIKLKDIMLLDNYELALRSYSSFGPIKPFKGWDIEQPTRTLFWYDAYNKTKHDREKQLSAATLKNTIYAVAAATIVFYARFGFHYNFQRNSHWPEIDRINDLIQVIFKLQHPSALAKDFSNLYYPNVKIEMEDGKEIIRQDIDWTCLKYF